MEILLPAVLGLIVTLLLSYFIIKGAVLEALKDHTRWSIELRDEIEAKYAKKPQA